MEEVRIFLTTPGAGTWTVPADCQKATIECIGGGASGGSLWWGGPESYGGGGGAYSKLNEIELTPGDSISYSVGLGGVHPSGSSAHWVSGTDTWFKSTSDVLAKGANHNTGGQASASVGDVKYNGGNGGPVAGAYGGSGGGAGGLNGNGKDGIRGDVNPAPGTYGSGDDGYGGNGAGYGGGGGNGAEWDATHGSGGGGGGNSFNGNGGKGGAYGAGGGGNYRLDLGAVPGAGADGIIVITYTPIITGSSKFFQLF